MSTYRGTSIAAISLIAFLALNSFAGAQTTPSAAELLMQDLQSPAPAATPTPAAATTTSQTPTVQVPLGVSLATSIPLSSSLVPQNSIIPAAAAATSTVAATASSTASLIQSLLAEVKALEAQIAELEVPSSTPSGALQSTTATSLTFTRNLSLYDTGLDVRVLQHFLNENGFPVAATGPGSTGEETTFFGLATYHALVAYQTANDLPATGYFGPETLAFIISRSASQPTAQPGNTASSTSNSSSSTASTTAISSPIPVTSTPGFGGGGGGGGATPDTTPPSISAITPSAACTTATIAWTTNENANSKVVYGTTTAYGSETSNASLVTSHSLGISGLTPSTTYHYAVVSTASSGNTATSTDQTFTTTSASAPAVLLTAPSSGATVAGSTVALSATASDGIGVANVQFKVDGANIGSTITSAPYTTTWNSTGVVDGSHTLSAVALNTSGLYATSSMPVSVENTPVSISSISSGSPTTSSATISWTTNEAASSTVAYGTTTSYGSASLSASLVTSHSITLTGLSAGTTYHYQVQATNAAGNYATSSDQTFATASNADATLPTTPTNLTAVAASLSELDLSWTASNDNGGGDSCCSYKIYRDGSQVGTTTSGTTYADTGLAASSTHAYIVKAYDAAGNVSSASNTATSTTGVWADGFATAPSGTAQYPNLLQNYSARAPWHVAGIDYAVGIPSGTSLSDPFPSGSLAPALVALGCAYNNSSYPLIICSGVNNITINAYDFTLHGGLSLFLKGDNATVTNCKFNSVAYTGFIDVQGAGVTVENNEFTLAYAGGVSLNYRGSGSAPVVFEYNYMHDMYGDAIADNGSASSVTIKYNVAYNMANWPDSTNGSGLTNHFNDFGFSAASSTVNNVAVSFNTYVQFPTGGYANSGSPQGGEFAQFYNNGSGSTLNNATFSNNTLIAEGGVNPLAVPRQNNTAYSVGTLLTVPGSADLLYMVYYAGTSSSTLPAAYSSTGVGSEFADGSGGMIVTGGNNLSVSYFLHGSNEAADPTLATGTLTIQNNYYGGLTNAYGVYYAGTWGTSNPPSGSSAWTASGNFSMDNGSAQNTLP